MWFLIISIPDLCRFSYFVRRFLSNIRAIAGNTSHIQLFLTLCIHVCSMHGRSIKEIKRMHHDAHFFQISHASFQHFTNFLEKKQVLNVKLKCLQSPSSHFILILLIVHDIKLSRKCEHLFVFRSRVKILHDIVW